MKYSICILGYYRNRESGKDMKYSAAECFYFKMKRYIHEIFNMYTRLLLYRNRESGKDMKYSADTRSRPLDARPLGPFT